MAEQGFELVESRCFPAAAVRSKRVAVMTRVRSGARDEVSLRTDEAQVPVGGGVAEDGGLGGVVEHTKVVQYAAAAATTWS